MNVFSTISYAICALLLSTQSVNAHERNLDWSSKQYNIVYQDFNGDGQQDVLLHAKFAGTPSLIMFSEPSDETIYKSKVLLPTQIQGNLWHGQMAELIFDDFNQDSRADLLIIFPTRANAFLFLSKQDQPIDLTKPDNIYTEQTWPWLNQAQQHIVKTGDFDGNGFPDLLIIASRPDVHTISYNENGHFIKHHRLSNTTQWRRFSSTSLFVSDFNGDDKTDLLFFDHAEKAPLLVFYADEQGRLPATPSERLNKIEALETWRLQQDSIGLTQVKGSNAKALFKLLDAIGGYDEFGKYWNDTPPILLAGQVNNEPTRPVTP